jgi:CcmD family protein
MMMRCLAAVLIAVALVFGLASSSPGPAFAFQPPPGQSEFVPMKDLPQTEQMPAAPLLVAAYAFIWVAVAAYVWTIWRRLGKVEAEIHALESNIARREPGARR